MKKVVYFLLFTFWSTLLYSQNIVVDGVTFSADRKTLIRYPEYKDGEEYIVPEGTETIGTEAFMSTAYLHEITLPISLKEIRDGAFAGSSVISIIWSNFPETIGEDIFNYSHIKEFGLSNDNLDCSIIDGVLFSKDKKILFRYPPQKEGDDYIDEYSIPNGTEFVEKRAFEGANLVHVILPYTLKEIGDHAFWVFSPIPVRVDDPYYRRLWIVTCHAVTPPLIVGDPFAYPRAMKLYVPDDSFDLYYNAAGWKDFKTINNIETPSSLKPILSSNSLKISLTDEYLNLESEKELSRVIFYNLNGLEIANCILNGYDYSKELINIFPELFILKVIYVDGMEEVFKLCK